MAEQAASEAAREAATARASTKRLRIIKHDSRPRVQGQKSQRGFMSRCATRCKMHAVLGYPGRDDTEL